MVSLDRFEMFCAVADAGSFTAAAALLNQTRAVVSFNVKQLEAELGVTLLTRTTRRVALTDAGERFHRRCAQVLEDARIAVDEARGEHTGLSGSLRVTTTVEYGLMVIAPALQAFMRVYPALQVQLETHSADVDLVRERFDIAIRLGQLRTRQASGYRGVCIDAFEVRPVIAPALLATTGRKRIDTPEALAALPRLGHRSLERVAGWTLEDRKGATRVYHPAGKPCLIADNASILRSFALQGTGVALLPHWLVRDDLDAGRLVDALPDYRFPRQSVYALYPAARHVPRKVRVWLDFLKDYLLRRDATPARRPAPSRARTR
ncbi:LysR family transcriptional regulator [Burkholderia alba]|uniref:LysR family transcriptional regulator n=1 Tax=Burkholderia alba TaxID=2683677 RepID=UPI002B058CFB|nr:LysR family transcriptional regulator [Burkholderia alba]